MAELNPTVQYLVERLESSIGPELKRIEEKDWSILEGDKLKKAQSVQKIWTKRNLDHAKKLYDEAKEHENLHHPQVKAVFAKVVRLVEIYEKRYEVYYNKNDWGKYMEDDDELEVDIEAELSYQSQLLDTLMDFQQKIIKFDLSNVKEKIYVPSFSKTPIPFIMRNAVESKYPEVKEFLEKKFKENESNGKV